MADYVLRVKVKEFEFEAHATTPNEVRSMIDDCTAKFLVAYGAYQKKKLNP